MVNSTDVAGLSDLVAMAMGPAVVTFVLLLVAWWVRRQVRIKGGHDVPLVQYGMVPLAVAILAWALLFSLAIARAHWSRERIYSTANEAFGQQVERLEADIHTQFEGVLRVLRAIRSTHVASTTITREEFRKWVTLHSLEDGLQGVNGYGIVEWVPRQQLDAWVARQRRTGSPDFKVSSQGNASDLFVVTMVEPFEANRAAWGLDLGAESVRRTAADWAKRSGQPSLTGRVSLVQDDQGRAGYLYFLPIYSDVKTPEDQAQRKEKFRVLAYAPIVLADLMAHSVAASQGLSHFSLFDEQTPDANALAFDSEYPASGAAQRTGATPPPASPMFTIVRPLILGGNAFSLQARSSPKFEQTIDTRLPLRQVFLESSIAVIVGLMLWILLSGRARAEALSAGMHSELAMLAMVAQRTSNAVVMTDASGRVTWVNDGFSRITGYSLEEAMGQVPGKLLQCEQSDPEVVARIREDLKAFRASHETLLNRHKNGGLYWIELEIQPLHDARGRCTGFMAVESDVTVIQQARLELVHEKERFANVLSGTHVGTWESNLSTGEWNINERWALMLGFARDEVLPNADTLWRERLHPDDRVRLQNAFDLCLEGKSEQYSCDVRVRHKDGHEVWILSRAKVMSRLKDGRVEWIGGVHTDITEAKRTELNLRDMEAFLERTGRVAGIGAWQVDLRSMSIKWNDQTCEIHGVEPGYTPDMADALSFYPEAARIEIVQAMERAKEMGASWDLTTPFVSAEGESRWVRTVGEVEFDDSGAVRLLGAIQDVTSQRVAQIKVERSEALLREAIDTINEAFVLYDPQDRLLFCNDKYRELYAESADLIVEGATFESIVRGGAMRGQYTDALGDVEGWVQKRLALHKAGNTLVEQNLPDGRWLRIIERKMPDGHTVGFRIDITELKQASETAKAAAEALAKTSSTLQAVLDSAVDVGVIATNAQQLINVFNTGAENLLGYDSGELLGKSTPTPLFEPSQISVVRESLSLALGREPTDDEVLKDIVNAGGQSEWTMVRKDGSTFTAALAMSVMVNSQGFPDGYLAVVHDISAQKDYEASLQKAMRLAEQSSVAKSQFLANMSHEIRTPMNAILGMLRLLHNTPLNDRQRDYADKTENAAKSLLGLLNDILDFSKVEAGKMQLDPDEFKLEDLLQDVSVILSSNLGSKNVDLVFAVDPQIPGTLVGDALRIKQVLINLGGNAVKFTAQGQVVVRLKLLARHPDRVRLQFAVEDSGIGIAPENQAKIFGAFTQAEGSTTRRFGGTGLGLVISTRLVRLMGGEVELQSEEGKGSVFSFSIDLPYVQESPSAQSLAQADAVAHVMVVDDNAVALDATVGMMRSLGWNVIPALSGQEAVDLFQIHLKSSGPALNAVFVDWQMPGMDGWETLRQICRLHGDKPLPSMVMFSSQGREMLAQRSVREQELLQGYLVKPLTAAMLRDALHEGRSDRAASNSGSETIQSMDAVLQRLAGMRILLMEDNPINQQVAQELLSGEGAQITLADNGQIGVDLVAAASPVFDVVLLDLQMPVMDGLTAARTIRRDLGLTNLPLIAMTANAMASDRADCLDAGMDDHVGKPFDLNDLVKTLIRHTHWQNVVSGPAMPVPAPSSFNDWPSGVDGAGALARMGGNLGVLVRSLQAFVRDAQVFAGHIKDLLRSGALGDVQRELHSLKGLSATLGIATLSQAAGVAEIHAKQVVQGLGQHATLVQSVADLERELVAWLPVLQELITQLQGSMDVKSGLAEQSSNLQLRAGLLEGLLALVGLLEVSDMGAMEMHANLPRAEDGSMDEDLEPLDAAMADMDFLKAADICRALVEHWKLGSIE